LVVLVNLPEQNLIVELLKREKILI